MRGQALIEHVTEVIQDAFDDDVAQALLSDEDTLANLARHLNRNYDDEQISAAVQQVARDLDDDTADWLVEQAENPAAWLYSRV
jgi:hypothetical protein